MNKNKRGVLKYDVYYNALNSEIGYAKDYIEYLEKGYYIEYYENGVNFKQQSIENEGTKLELIEKDVEENRQDNKGRIDLYKDSEGTLYLAYVSYYVGEFTIVEITSEETLKKEFNYTLF